MKPKFIMNTYTIIWTRIPVFPIGVFETSNHDNEVFAIIFQYTISDLQTPEILQFLTRGSKWSDVKNVIFS